MLHGGGYLGLDTRLSKLIQEMAGRTTASEEVCPKLLTLSPKERDWLMNSDGRGHQKSFEEQKLELRLGPPCEVWDSMDLIKETDQSATYPGYFTSVAHNGQNASSSTLSRSHHGEKNPFLPSSANTAVPNSSQKRTASGPVVGWPPIRSFRKNLASSDGPKSSSDTPPQHGHVVSAKAGGKNPIDCSSSSRKGMFVKINMDGVPIGRKVDLLAFDSYGKLSSAVDELFRGLLAAQRDSSATGIQNKEEDDVKAISGLLDGSGEYTLVYEDNEGDRMLVGDVPWQMFVSTVKRLRVLKSSELPSLGLDSKQDG